MKRREFVCGAVALLAPLAAPAQQPVGSFRIGFLSSGRQPANASADAFLGALTERLRELGPNQRFTLEARYAEGNVGRLPALARELAGLQVDALLAAGNPAVDAARRATRTIPIVMLSADPVAAGFVPSLGRPGGNLTGLTVDAGLAIWGKRLQLLRECVPALRRVGVISRTGGRQGSWVKELDAAASRMALGIVHAGAKNAGDFPAAFAALDEARIDALLASDSPLYFQYRRLIIDFAARKRLPAIHAYREAVEDRGLMSYGVEIGALYEKAADYLDRILKGAKPADLPIEQPTKFEFAINLRAAKALGIEVPQSLLIRADRVIE